MQEAPLDQPVLDKTLLALAPLLDNAAAVAALELAVCRAIALTAVSRAFSADKPDFAALIAQLRVLFGPERKLGEPAKKLMEVQRPKLSLLLACEARRVAVRPAASLPLTGSPSPPSRRR